MKSLDKQSAILAEQTRQLYIPVNQAVLATLVNGSIVAGVLWPVIEQHRLLIWLVFLLLVSLGRFALHHWYTVSKTLNEKPNIWYQRFLLGSIFSALIWTAAAIWLFPPDDPARQVFLAFVIAGMAASALTTLCYLPLPVLLFLSLTLLPLLIQFFLSKIELSMVMGSMLSFYLVMLSIAARRNYLLLRQSICLQFDSMTQQQSLIESQQRYQILLETETDSFFLHDMQGRFVDVNQQACTSLGYTREELLALSVVDIEVGADQQKLLEIWPKLEQVGRFQLDCVHLRKDRSTFPVEVRFGVVLVGSERLISVLVRDITAQRQAEETIRDSQQKMTMHLQHTPLGVIECDSDSLVTEWNPAAEKIFGFSKTQAMGRDVCELIIPDDVKNQVHRVWDQVLATHDGFQSINDNKTNTGERITCQWYNTPLIDKKGAVIGMASLVQDITEKLRAQQKLAERQSSYRTLFELSDEAIMTLGDTGFIDCNQATLKLFGYTDKSQFLNLHPSEVSPPQQPSGTDSHTEAEQVIAKAYSQGKNRAEWVHRRANGEDFPAEVLLTPMTLEGQEVLQAIVRDMTEQKQKESHLLAAKQEAERSNRAKSEFLSRMSHELRTPLNAVLGFGQLLALKNKDRSEIEQGNVREILAAGYYLLNLINELLDMAKIESGKMNLSIEAVEMDDLLSQCLMMIGHQAQLQHLTLTDNISNRGFVVLADHSRLKQVLLNLLSNAIKYNCDQGQIILTAEVIKNAEAQRLKIYVTDTGDGISEAEINRLFTPFERLTTNNHIEGTGIGLTISKHLVELMGGSIGVESTLGKGCSFWLEVALQPKRETAIHPTL